MNTYTSLDSFSQALGVWFRRLKELTESRDGINSLPSYIIGEAQPRPEGPHPRAVGMNPTFSARTIELEAQFYESMQADVEGWRAELDEAIKEHNALMPVYSLGESQALGAPATAHPWKVGDVGRGEGYSQRHYTDSTDSLLTESGRFVVVEPNWHGEFPLVCSWDEGEPKPDPLDEDERGGLWCPEESATPLEEG